MQNQISKQDMEGALGIANDQLAKEGYAPLQFLQAQEPWRIGNSEGTQVFIGSKREAFAFLDAFDSMKHFLPLFTPTQRDVLVKLEAKGCWTMAQHCRDKWAQGKLARGSVSEYAIKGFSRDFDTAEFESTNGSPAK